MQGRAGEPGGEDEYVEGGPSVRAVCRSQEVRVCVCERLVPPTSNL